jgi:hypothetical protein
MNKDDLIPRLISEFGYPPKGAQIVGEKLVKSSPQIQQAFIRFWEAGEIPSMVVEGYTVSRLADEHGMKPIAALLTLDWLIRDPVQAKISLHKGHDFVISKKN